MMAIAPEAVDAKFFELSVKISFHFRNTEILTDLPSKFVRDLVMSRHCGTAIQFRVMPPRMASAFAKKLTTVRRQVSQKLFALHTAIGNSRYPSPA